MFESVALLFVVLAHILPGTTLTLTTLLASFFLPAAVIWLLIVPATRRVHPRPAVGEARYTGAVEE
ncbi:MAG: hypothetical protein ACR2JY_13805 [Chloroflexota bacterium]